MPLFEVVITKSEKLVYRQSFGEPNKNKHFIDLLLGVASALNSFAPGMGTKSCDSFHTFATGEYKLHMFESVSGFKIFLLTTPMSRDLRPELQFIYSDLFVPLVLNNPLVSLDDQPIDAKVCCSGFASRLKQQLTSLPV